MFFMIEWFFMVSISLFKCTFASSVVYFPMIVWKIWCNFCFVYYVRNLALVGNEAIRFIYTTSVYCLCLFFFRLLLLFAMQLYIFTLFFLNILYLWLFGKCFWVNCRCCWRLSLKKASWRRWCFFCCNFWTFYFCFHFHLVVCIEVRSHT